MIGFDAIVTSIDAYSNRQQIKYDGATKSSYIYNSETAEYDFLKSYDYLDNLDRELRLIDKVTPFINAPKVIADQFSGTFVNGFQGASIALYEGTINGVDLNGLKIDRLGYKPLLDIESTTIYNNGKWVTVNLHSQGLDEFTKVYTSSLLRIVPFKANLSNNKIFDNAISSTLKTKLREWIEGN